MTRSAQSHHARYPRGSLTSPPEEKLAERYDRQRHGQVKLHFYTFGGLRATSEWVAGFVGREG